MIRFKHNNSVLLGLIAFFSCLSIKTNAQELYVYSEPASNMAAKGIGFRLSNSFMRVAKTSQYDYMLAPEVMVGINKNLMLHAEGYLSNSTSTFKVNGGSFYAKYRFFSQDDVHSHLRMAASLRVAGNNAPINDPVINLMGKNSGISTGLIITQLINKVAVSGGINYTSAWDNGSAQKFQFTKEGRNALQYNLSIGKLMLPKEYVNYEQTNLNLMLEGLGQTNFKSGRTQVDLAPSIQFIFHSRMRLDLGYRFAVVNKLNAFNTDQFLLRFEYNIFNAF